MPSENKTIHDGGVIVPYMKLKNEKSEPKFFNIVAAHAKAVPGPQKYLGLTPWPLKKGRSALPKEQKVTYLGEAAKISKKLPGPTSYNAHKCMDKMVLPRTMGLFKSTLNKLSSIDLESFAKKDIPGPLHKY